jgi:hypothetical protein
MRNASWLIAFVVACDVGDAGTGRIGQSPDAASPTIDASPDASSSGGPIDAPNNGCIAKQPSPGDGHHNAGQDCMNGCHNHGFTIAGTVYSAVNGGAPVIGATVEITDGAGQKLKIVSQNNGNFYTSNPVTFPLTVNASSCPNIQAMTATVTGTNTIGCNKNGCHTAGNYIHLP